MKWGLTKKKLFANMKIIETPNNQMNTNVTLQLHNNQTYTHLNLQHCFLNTCNTANQSTTHPPNNTTIFQSLWKSASKFAKFKWITICLQNLLHILRWQFPHIIRNHQNFQRHFKTTTTQQLENKISISLQQHEKIYQSSTKPTTTTIN